MDQQDFVKYVRSTCKEYGIRCIFKRSKIINDDFANPCEGLFYTLNDKPYLIIAYHSDSWFETLIHEFGHANQYIDGNWISYEEINSIEMFEYWINKKHHNKQLAILATHLILETERDCERRAVQIIKKFNLPVDLNLYIRWANMGLYQYLYGLKHRFWPKTILSPNYPEWELIPLNFNRQYKKLPLYVEELITKAHKEWMLNYQSSYSLKTDPGN